jgi:hypothetical protein
MAAMSSSVAEGITLRTKEINKESEALGWQSKNGTFLNGVVLAAHRARIAETVREPFAFARDSA